MFRYSPGLRFVGFLLGCFFGLGAIEIFERGNPDELGQAIGALAVSLIGFSTLFARYG